MRALVLSVSNRAAAGVYADTTGPLIAERLTAWGFETDGPQVVPDGAPVGEALRAAVAAAYDVVITTGGTGISPTDETPERTSAVIEKEIPGIAEAIRAYGIAQGVPTAALSRGTAGIAGKTLIVNLPGSRGGVKDGLVVLEPLVRHAVDQLAGGDHPRTDLAPDQPGGGDHPGTELTAGQPAGDHSRTDRAPDQPADDHPRTDLASDRPADAGRPVSAAERPAAAGNPASGAAGENVAGGDQLVAEGDEPRVVER